MRNALTLPSNRASSGGAAGGRCARGAIAGVAIIGILNMCNLAWSAASFIGLGTLPGQSSSFAAAVSADGSTVVGFVPGSGLGTEAFRWTAATGIVSLGFLPGSKPPSSAAYGVSADGSAIVGFSNNSTFEREAFHWTASGGMVGLGFLNSAGIGDSQALGVSGNGSVVVGYSNSPSGAFEAFRWTVGGMVGLGDLPGSNFESVARDVSADGSVVVGYGHSASTTPPATEAFRWTAGGGMMGLGFLPVPPGHTSYSEAFGVSADGTVVVGSCLTFSGYDGFRWTAAGGMVPLGFTPSSPLDDAGARAASADGSTIVGWGGDGIAMIWDVANGARNLKSVLVALGADVTGWTLTKATGISADGLTIVGEGLNPFHHSEAWVATIPEPAALALFSVVGLLIRHRQAPRAEASDSAT